jgi:hypothetical protein
MKFLNINYKCDLSTFGRSREDQGFFFKEGVWRDMGHFSGMRWFLFWFFDFSRLLSSKTVSGVPYYWAINV